MSLPTIHGLALALESMIHRGNPPFVITADLAGPLGLKEFARNYPHRFINVGVAEQAMIGVACGLAASGIPCIATSFATFILRGTEQIRNLLVLDGWNVVIVASHAGLATGPNGVTHQALEDIGIMSSLKGMQIWSPCSAQEASYAIQSALSEGGPHYVRLTRWTPPCSPFLPSDYPSIPFGVENNIVAVLISHGIATALSVKAAKILSEHNIPVRVIHVPRLAPLPIEEIFCNIAPDLPVFTVEDHFADSGLGSLLSMATADRTQRPRFIMIGAQIYGGSDEADKLLSAACLDASSIAIQVMQELDNDLRRH